MTDALCLSCGDIKFGAFLECESCSAGSTGNIDLDIVFTDHHYSIETLQEFGAVIKKIHTQSEDDNICYLTFIAYISENHPSILSIEWDYLDDTTKEQVWYILNNCNMPNVTLRDSMEKKRKKR